MLDLLPMNDGITLSKGSGYDDWGIAVEADPVKVRGNYRYNTTRDKIITDKGDEIVYSANVYLPFGTDITYETTVMFVDEYGSEIKKKPLTIQHKRDIWNGPMLIRVVV